MRLPVIEHSLKALDTVAGDNIANGKALVRQSSLNFECAVDAGFNIA
jgi:hypothetical protein